MVTQLNHRIALYVPATVNGNEPASPRLVAKWVTTAKKKFAELFGGFTSYQAVGGWLSPVHGLIEERVTVVSAHTDEAGLDLVDEVTDFAAEMADALGQEAVAVEVNNALQFVGPVCAAA